MRGIPASKRSPLATPFRVGIIQVESTRGKGSTFRVEIPVLKVEDCEMPVSGIHRGQIVSLEPGQPEHRILIVDDHVENRLLLQRLLHNVGFQVQVAEDGVSGIENLLTWKPHFIWMDWRLPGLDGLEATRRIRGLDSGQVKIVVLSAFAFTEHRQEALASGVDDFVSKPFRAQEIFDCLSRHLGVRYRYQSAGTARAASVLGQEALISLPAELRKELADALVSLQSEQIVDVISRISKQNATLGRTLSQYAERSAYSPILQALQSCDPVQT